MNAVFSATRRHVLTLSEQNQQNFLDGCYSGARSLAYYAPLTNVTRNEGIDLKVKRVQEQFEVFMATLEGSRDLKIELAILLFNRAIDGDRQIKEFLGRTALEFDRNNPAGEEE